MSAENLTEVTIFRTARKIDGNNERAAFLDQACAGNDELRERVEKLLAVAAKDSEFLEQPALRGDARDFELELERNSRRAPTMPPSYGASSDQTDSLSFERPTNNPESDSAVILTQANQSVLRLMNATLAEVPRVSLREETQDEGPIQRPNSEEMPEQISNGRYRLDAEIARGGMGAILRGRDVDIGRDLAIKVLLTSHKDRPEVVQRFIEEAQISGQLQHPGIAPVYDIGQFVDERPYMSMKLVKGDTLSKQLADRKDPQEDRTKLIGVFKQICETMAYAHSRGVIHRDLKPANIMLGAFGEVQVMDWGLGQGSACRGRCRRKACEAVFRRAKHHPNPA